MERFLLNGEWRSSTRVRPVVNPFTDRMEHEVAQAGEVEFAEAIETADAMFRREAVLPAYRRAEVCNGPETNCLPGGMSLLVSVPVKWANL